MENKWLDPHVERNDFDFFFFFQMHLVFEHFLCVFRFCNHVSLNSMSDVMENIPLVTEAISLGLGYIFKTGREHAVQLRLAVSTTASSK